ncbi:MAG: hypothetical protein ACK2UW_08920 [Anaerolineales bacterium]|jgi:hypothetical protein
MAVVATKFDPQKHGFHFVNSFEFPYLFNISLPLLGPRSIGDIIIGLCGGMCSGALDYYHKDKTIPADTNTEKIPLSLFRYLWSRQLDTLSMPVLEKLFTWAIMDTRLLSRLTERNEIPKLRASIDAGQPAMLVLLRARGLLSLTQNHQVLATAYDYNPSTKDLSVKLYDPNHPGQVPTLSMNLSSPWLGLKLSQSTKEPLRAFFVIDYLQKDPPK